MNWESFFRPTLGKFGLPAVMVYLFIVGLFLKQAMECQYCDSIRGKVIYLSWWLLGLIISYFISCLYVYFLKWIQGAGKSFVSHIQNQEAAKERQKHQKIATDFINVLHKLSKGGKVQVKISFNDSNDEYNFLNGKSPEYKLICKAVDKCLSAYKVKKEYSTINSKMAGKVIPGEGKYPHLERFQHKDKKGNHIDDYASGMRTIISPDGTYKNIFEKSRRIQRRDYILENFSLDHLKSLLGELKDIFDNLPSIVEIKTSKALFEIWIWVGDINLKKIFPKNKFEEDTIHFLKEKGLEEWLVSNSKEYPQKYNPLELEFGKD